MVNIFMNTNPHFLKDYIGFSFRDKIDDRDRLFLIGHDSKNSERSYIIDVESNSFSTSNDLDITTIEEYLNSQGFSYDRIIGYPTTDDIDITIRY